MRACFIRNEGGGKGGGLVEGEMRKAKKRLKGEVGFSPVTGKGLLTEFIGILSTSHHGKSPYFSPLVFHGGGHTANWALLASLCKILVMHFFQLSSHSDELPGLEFTPSGYLCIASQGSIPEFDIQFQVKPLGNKRESVWKLHIYP
ncbi:hypothetical protein J1N35_030833 [Gossypium stocksii]|uniref:Uncharacterized protein n=1 Tax=Gossypium stocksii TaxID=47602 RepID=A0A9D3V0S9_9ROSI|nr:hypothetical protein J1N35_030833 [Gossypium stocksii]